MGAFCPMKVECPDGQVFFCSSYKSHSGAHSFHLGGERADELISALLEERACLVAALGVMPLSLREAVSRRDVEACRAWAKHGDDFVAGLQREVAALGRQVETARTLLAADLDRRYTTRETMDLCMRLAGVDAWDLDVAADEESRWAPRWFGVEQDGLKQEWRGRVWCNPPYSDIETWVRKAWVSTHYPSRVDVIGMLLPANRTEQPWWQNLVERQRDGRNAGYLTTHFLPGRVRFGHPGNRDAVGVGSPPFGCVLLVWRRP